MAIKPIIKHPDQRLYTTCEPFNFETDKQHLIDLRSTFRDAQGGRAWGLSLPQIGVTKAAFIMVIQGIETFVCNPVISQFSRERLTMVEGCLSMPWLKVNVERRIGIRGVFRTGVGDLAQFELDGMESRVFQHEFEHLMGVTLAMHHHKAVKMPNFSGSQEFIMPTPEEQTPG